MIENLQRADHRLITKRIIIRVILVLDTPTCLGSGDAEAPTDLALLRDSISDRALLTGSSLGGALRNYLHEYEQGYGENEIRQGLVTKLFGHLFRYEGEESNEEENQSPLIIDDAISSTIPVIELRDGVKIDGATGTAEDSAKYDLELLEAGTEFFLNFELLIEKDEADLKKALALALRGLEQGEISLGMKKRRGFGRCHVKEWQVWKFDLTDPGDRTAWLLFDRECTKSPVITNKIADALGVVLDEGEDKRDRFTIQATFKLVSSLLIRSGQAETGLAPDVVHLKSHRPGKIDPEPVLSGTSLAGVLRHRAERIVNTLEKPTTIIDEIFGPDFSEDKTKEAKASRLIVHESTINQTTDLVQTRIAIDRFTGGAYHGALFQEQPIFGKGDENLNLEIELRQPEPYEIGLLLLLLKDLWTEDLPVGGGSSVGRGRLKGKKATLKRKSSEWNIEDDNNSNLRITPKNAETTLEYFVSELVKYLKENHNNEPSNS
ncbi:MAG: hypothetical protein F6K45_09715 [Kamptonema sp. SIO1D9]|nr:hypothetical protein [Kamptonema sp. SIO1D9]